MNSKSKLEQAAKSLQKMQLANGGFESVSLATRYAKQGDHTYRTTFFPSLILQALKDVRLKPVKDIRKQIADFLIEQKSA